MNHEEKRRLEELRGAIGIGLQSGSDDYDKNGLWALAQEIKAEGRARRRG